MGIDFIIFLAVVLSAIIFCFLGDGKIHKIYFGIIIGFLLFLVFNSQIHLLEMSPDKNYSFYQTFLVENKELILSLGIVFIPLMGVLFLLNTSISIHVKNNIFFSILFGGGLPLFLLTLLGYVGEHSYMQFDFLSDFLSIFSHSSLFQTIQENTFWAILGLLFLLFYRAFFLLLFAFINWLYTVFRDEFFGKPEEEENNKEE